VHKQDGWSLASINHVDLGARRLDPFILEACGEQSLPSGLGSLLSAKLLSYERGGASG
jgi:hypothetical protein